MPTVKVLTERLGEAKHALEKLVKKANKYGNDPITYFIGEEVLEKKTIEGFEEPVLISFTNIEVDGGAPRVGEFKFLAKIEVHEGGNLVDTAPECHVNPAYFTTDDHCDHCKINRHRNLVYIVEKNTGEQLQVGRSCLRDFLGIDDPNRVAARFEFFKHLKDLDNEYGFGKLSWNMSIEYILTVASAAVRLWGWCSRAMESNNPGLKATASAVSVVWASDAYLGKEQIAAKHLLLSSMNDEDTRIAKATMDFVRNDLEGDGEYVHNLKVLFKEDILHNEKRIGIVVSAIAAYLRHIDALKARAKALANPSDYVGEIGKRLRGLQVTVKNALSRESFYGPQILYIFNDENDNVLVWYANGRGIDAKIGDALTITGTIKKHDEFRGVKQTRLNRVVVDSKA